MADHMRKQALDAITTAVTGLATTGANVFLGRVSPLEREQVPALVIRGGPERIEPDGLTRPRFQQRFYQVDVLVHVREADDYEEVLNQIIKEVETALASGSVPAGFGAKTITLRFIEAPLKAQNELTYVQSAMNFEVFYVAAENAPDVPK